MAFEVSNFWSKKPHLEDKERGASDDQAIHFSGLQRSKGWNQS